MTDKPTYDDWKPLADKEVKGRDLTWHTPEGIAVKPLYTSQDTAAAGVGVRRDAGAPAAGTLCPGVATRRGARGVLGGERLRGVRGRVVELAQQQGAQPLPRRVAAGGRAHEQCGVPGAQLPEARAVGDRHGVLQQEVLAQREAALPQ